MKNFLSFLCNLIRIVRSKNEKKAFPKWNIVFAVMGSFYNCETKIQYSILYICVLHIWDIFLLLLLLLFPLICLQMNRNGRKAAISKLNIVFSFSFSCMEFIIQMNFIWWTRMAYKFHQKPSKPTMAQWWRKRRKEKNEKKPIFIAINGFYVPMAINLISMLEVFLCAMIRTRPQAVYSIIFWLMVVVVLLSICLVFTLARTQRTKSVCSFRKIFKAIHQHDNKNNSI